MKHSEVIFCLILMFVFSVVVRNFQEKILCFLLTCAQFVYYIIRIRYKHNCVSIAPKFRGSERRLLPTTLLFPNFFAGKIQSSTFCSFKAENSNQCLAFSNFFHKKYFSSHFVTRYTEKKEDLAAGFGSWHIQELED